MSEVHGGHQGEPTYGPPYPSSPPHGYRPPETYGGALQHYNPAAAPASYPGPRAAGVVGHRLVSAGGRLGAALLDGLLMLCTLWIGWLIWAMITWSDGQTPAKKLLGHVVVDANNGQPLDWGRMALREFCIKGLLGWVLALCTFSIYFWVDSLMVFGDRQRTLHDRMASSIVRHV
jgi:hypothetical protein